MSKATILVVEDEEDILELIRFNLLKEGYSVMCAVTGESGIEIANKKMPDLIVLDLMLGGIDGLEACRRLKHNPRTQAIPIMMVTAKSEDIDVVTGLELGADDYLTKPFSPKILIARIRTLLRRAKSLGQETTVSFRVHDLIINPGKREVLVKGKPIELTYTEFQILHFLAKKPGWVYSRYQIVDGIHVEEYAVTDRAVDVQIVGLRKKLGTAGKYIETVRGVGYRFKESV